MTTRRTCIAALATATALALTSACGDSGDGGDSAGPGNVGVGQGGEGENFLASDAMALAGVTDQIIYLEEGDVVDLQPGKYWIVDRAHKSVTRPVRPTLTSMPTSLVVTSSGGYLNAIAHRGARLVDPSRRWIDTSSTFTTTPSISCSMEWRRFA